MYSSYGIACWDLMRSRRVLQHLYHAGVEFPRTMQSSQFSHVSPSFRATNNPMHAAPEVVAADGRSAVEGPAAEVGSLTESSQSSLGEIDNLERRFMLEAEAKHDMKLMSAHSLEIVRQVLHRARVHLHRGNISQKHFGTLMKATVHRNEHAGVAETLRERVRHRAAISVSRGVMLAMVKYLQRATKLLHGLMALSTIVLVLYEPWQIAFWHQTDPNLMRVFRAFELTVDIVAFLESGQAWLVTIGQNIVQESAMQYLEQSLRGKLTKHSGTEANVLVQSATATSCKHGCRWNLCVACASTVAAVLLQVSTLLPYQYIMLLPESLEQRRALGLLLLLKLFRVRRLPRYRIFVKWIQALNVERVYLVVVVLSVHVISWYAGCLFHFFGFETCYGNNCSEEAEAHEVIEEVVQSTYWALITVVSTSPPENYHPQNVVEFVFVMVVVTIGAFVGAVIFGAVFREVQRVCAAQDRYINVCSELEEFGRLYNIKSDTMARCKRHVDFQWRESHHFAMEQFLHRLPSCLQRDIKSDLLCSFVQRVLRVESDESEETKHMLSMVCVALKQELMAPKEYVFYEGEHGSKMYVLRTGIVLVLKQHFVRKKKRSALQLPQINGRPIVTHSVLNQLDFSVVTAYGCFVRLDVNDARELAREMGVSLPDLNARIGSTIEAGSSDSSSLELERDQIITRILLSRKRLRPALAKKYSMKVFNPIRQEVIERNWRAHRHHVRTLYSGSCFGEIALVESTQRTASVVTHSWCELYSLDKAAFHEVMQNYPALYDRIAGNIKRIRQSSSFQSNRDWRDAVPNSTGASTNVSDSSDSGQGVLLSAQIEALQKQMVAMQAKLDTLLSSAAPTERHSTMSALDV